jgi:hypothetical protein
MLLGTYDTATRNTSAASPRPQTKLALCRQADALLKRAGCDTMSAARKDRAYRKAKRAESKRRLRHYRARCKRFGKLGKASGVRTIPVFWEEAR